MKDENYVVVQGWMINKLGLAGKELLLYALIYGFTQDGETEFSGSLSYIGDFLGVRRDNVKRTMKPLIERGLIEKRTQVINGVAKCFYVAADGDLKMSTSETCENGPDSTESSTGCTQNGDRGVLKMSTGCTQNESRGVLKMGTNNIEDKYIDTSINNTPKRTTFTPPTFAEVSSYISEKGLNVDPCKFIDYYTKTEWHDVTGKKIKNWKLKLVSWDSRAKPSTNTASTPTDRAQLEYMSRALAEFNKEDDDDEF